MPTISQLQRVLAYANLYTGVIDGIMGPKTNAAIAMAVAEANAGLDESHKFPASHYIAAMQWILKKNGFYLGRVDGLWGMLSETAMTEFETFLATGKTVNEVAEPLHMKPAPKRWTLFSTSEAIAKFGNPGKEVESRLVSVHMPYPLVIEWDTKSIVSTIRLHELVAPAFSAAFDSIAKHYTRQQIESLKINLYSGSYNMRRVRGGASWSKHAFGIAVDFYATANGLMTPWDRAAFSRPDYAAFVAAFEAQGIAPLGKVMGRDAMHFEFAKESH